MFWDAARMKNHNLHIALNLEILQALDSLQD